MAIFHCQAKAISRANGRSATAAAAYRAGEKITDERTGEVHDYSRKEGVEHSEIFSPFGLQLNRGELWNAAEAAEKRKDAKVAREWEIALPDELTESQRKELAREFGKALVERYGVAADVCIHQPGKEGDKRNHHAHILTTTRAIQADGTLGEKTRVLDSPRTSGQEVEAVRQLWAEMANQALERAGRSERIDPRTLENQGIERPATQHMGPTATAIERRGGSPRRTADRADDLADHDDGRRLAPARATVEEAKEKRVLDAVIAFAEGDTAWEEDFKAQHEAWERQKIEKAREEAKKRARETREAQEWAAKEGARLKALEERKQVPEKQTDRDDGWER